VWDSRTVDIVVWKQDKQYIRSVKAETVERYNNPCYKPSIDKSGCDLTQTRKDLQRRLTMYKVNKRAKEAAETDYSGDMHDIKTSFDDLKSRILACFAKADSAMDYETVLSVVSYKFERLIQNIELVKKHVEQNDFSSVKVAREAIEGIKSTIAVLKNKLEEKNNDNT
jgi:hypothetical protein